MIVPKEAAQAKKMCFQFFLVFSDVKIGWPGFAFKHCCQSLYKLLLKQKC